jgi:hypothetical protein
MPKTQIAATRLERPEAGLAGREAKPRSARSGKEEGGPRGKHGFPRAKCAGEDLNLHDLAATRPSTLRVYQFRHQRVAPV